MSEGNSSCGWNSGRSCVRSHPVCESTAIFVRKAEFLNLETVPIKIYTKSCFRRHESQKIYIPSTLGGNYVIKGGKPDIFSLTYCFGKYSQMCLLSVSRVKVSEDVQQFPFLPSHQNADARSAGSAGWAPRFSRLSVNLGGRWLALFLSISSCSLSFIRWETLDYHDMGNRLNSGHS